MTLLYLVAKVTEIFLSAISFAMLARMLLPLFTDPEESRLYYFVYCLTEPVVLPVRFVLVKFNRLQDSPIDWAFSIAYLLLMFAQMLLPALG